MGKIIDVTLRLVDKMTSPLTQASTKLADSAKQWRRAGSEIEKVGNEIATVGTNLTAAITTPVATMGVTAVQNFGNVDKTLKLVEATMGDAKWATADLESALKKAAANSVFTMQEAADATLNFARQGFSAQEAAEMLEPALSLAAATATDLSSVTSGLGNSMKIFADCGLTASEGANLYAHAQAQANTTTSDLFKALEISSPIYKSIGWSMKDLAAITDVFGDNSIDGSVGATAMKTGLARLVSPAKDGAAWIKKLGLHITNTDGTMKSMVDVQEQLYNSFAKLTDTQQMQAASAIFGKNQMSNWLALIKTAPETVQNYRNSLDGLNGTATNMADSLMSGVGGAIEKLTSTFDVFKYSIGSNLAEPAQQGIEKVTSMIESFNGLDESSQKTILQYAGMAAATGPAVAMFGKTVGFVGTTTKNIGNLGLKLKDFKGNVSEAGAVLKTMQMPKLKLPKILTGAGKKIASPFKFVKGAAEEKAFGLISAGAAKTKNSIHALGASFGNFKGQHKILGGALSGIGKTFKGVAKAPVAMYSPFKKAGQMLGTTGKAFFTLMGPAGTAVVAIAGIVAAGILLYKNWDTVKEKAKQLGDWVKNIFESCGFDIQGFVGDAKGYFSDFIAKAQELWTFVKPYVDKLGELFMVGLKGYLATAIGGAIGVLGSLLQSVTDIFGSITQIFSGLIDFITGVFTGNWQQAWTGVKDIFGGIFDALVNLAKLPINAVISLINGAVQGINSIGITIPDWVPGIGGADWHVNLPTLPLLYTGTNDWKGGPAIIHDRGAEIVDLPSGTRVYPHDKSMKMAYQAGASSGKASVVIAKIADQIVVREEADIDKIVDRLARKLQDTWSNIGAKNDEYISDMG